MHGNRLPLGSVPGCVARNVIFLSEDRAAEGLFHQMMVRDNLVAPSVQRHARLGVLDRPALRRLAAGQLAEKLGIDRRRLRSIGNASQRRQPAETPLRARAGQHGGACVLLMNEPTRGIDVGARADIYRLMRELCDQGFSLLVASSDLEEVAGIADIVVTTYRGEIVARYERGEIDIGRNSRRYHPPRAYGRARRARRRGAGLMKEFALWRSPLVAVRAIAAVALALTALLTPGFLSQPSLLSLLTTVSFIGCVAVGMTLITISGNIMSFSLGALVGATSMIFILAVNARAASPSGLTAAFAFAALINAAQGFLIGTLRANPIIISIAATALIYGVAEAFTEQGNGLCRRAGTHWGILQGKIFGLPVEFVVLMGAGCCRRAIFALMDRVRPPPVHDWQQRSRGAGPRLADMAHGDRCVSVGRIV